MEDWQAAGLNIGGTALGTWASISDIKAKGKATLAAIDAEANSYAIQSNILLEQDQDLDRELGDVMSQNALKAMKAESRMKAGAAETGTSGGTTTNATKEAYMVQTLDNAILISRKRQSETDLARRQLMLKVGFDNKMQSLVGGMQSGESAFMNTLSGAASGYKMTYNMMSDAQKYEAFGGGYAKAGLPGEVIEDDGWMY